MHLIEYYESRNKSDVISYKLSSSVKFHWFLCHDIKQKDVLPVNEIVIGMLFPSDVGQTCLVGQMKCFLQNYAVAYLFRQDDEMANDEEN